MTPPRTAGAALVAALAALAALALPLVGPATAAAAAPLPRCAARPDPAAAVQVTVSGLEPRTIRPGGDPVQVLAMLRNCGTAPLTRLRVRLRSGAELFTRGQLAADDGQPLIPRAAGDWLDLPPAPLATGAATTVLYQTSATDLRMTAIGVYPAEFQVQAVRAEGAGREPAGEVRTYLPFFPDGVAAPTEVSWLLPFVDRPHRLYEPPDDTAGADDRILIDDHLSGQLEGTGRLNRLLTVAANADQRGVPYTIAVDPDLIDTIHGMTLGYKFRISSRATADGAGKQSATVWLNRLIDLATRHEVIAVPYADADLVALTGAGLGELAHTRQETLQTLGEQLHVTVNTKIAWPAGGLLTDRALDSLVGQDAQAVVLDAAALPNAPPSGRTLSAASPLPSVSGEAVALVADPGVGRLVGGTVPIAGGPRLAEQRYLAELAMITAEAPSVGRRILVAPPHTWSPNASVASAMMEDTRETSWLAAGSVATLARTPARDLVERGALSYPRGAPELAGYQIGRIRKAQELVNQFGTALDNVAENSVLGRFTHALQRAASSSWRTTPGAAPDSPAGAAARAGAIFLAPIGNEIKTIVRDEVYIVPPQDGKYSLASRNSMLPLTVVNKLNVRVHLRVRISAQGTVGFQATEMDATLEAGKRTLVRIPTTVTQSGRFRVNAVLLTRDGKQLNSAVSLTVQSTAYGVVALGITGAAFGLLLLLLARRVVHRIRSGPGLPVQPAGNPGERGRSASLRANQ
jgi:hypothetical protein